MVKYQGSITLPPGEKLAVFSDKSDYIKGTGRFKGTKCEVSFSGKNITPYGKETKGKDQKLACRRCERLNTIL